jgi:general stress protein 26
MHYVVFEGDVVVMSALKSKKVTYIQEHGTLDITFDIDQNLLDTVRAEVIDDEEYVDKVYHYMIETNNAYFEDGLDDLCVIKIR